MVKYAYDNLPQAAADKIRVGSAGAKNKDDDSKSS